MCPDCKDLLKNPTHRPGHLVNPSTHHKAVPDPYGRLICPDLNCLTLWESDRPGPWRAIQTKGGLSKKSAVQRLRQPKQR